MRIRIATAAVAAVLAVTAVGCGSGADDKDDIGAPAPSASGAAGSSAPAEPEGEADGDTGAGAGASDSPTPEASGAALPPEPRGADRDDVMRVVFDVDVDLFKDEEKAIDAARKQCAALDSGVADPDHSAAELFSYNGITPTDEDGSHLNYGLRRTLCPAS